MTQDLANPLVKFIARNVARTGAACPDIGLGDQVAGGQIAALGNQRFKAGLVGALEYPLGMGNVSLAESNVCAISEKISNRKSAVALSGSIWNTFRHGMKRAPEPVLIWFVAASKTETLITLVLPTPFSPSTVTYLVEL